MKNDTATLDDECPLVIYMHPDCGQASLDPATCPRCGKALTKCVRSLITAVPDEYVEYLEVEDQ